VILTSLFTETVFNAHVQNETLSATPIYSSDEVKFKFISVGREGNTEQACDEIDFVIIRFDISSEDAMDVLNLLLTCLVNETTNQTATVYSYVSTKLNGTSATMMNLPISVLQYIPWYCNFSDSLKGPRPQTFADWFWAPLITVGRAIVGVFIFIGMAIVELVMVIIDFFMEVFMDILPILQYILWLIIRVLILILVWITFAFTLLLTIILFVTIMGSAFMLNTFMDLDIQLSINEIVIEGDIYFSLRYDIEMEHNEFLGFFIPTIEIHLNMSDIALRFSLNMFSINLEIIDFTVDLLEYIDDNGLEQSAEVLPKTSNTSSIFKGIVDFLSGMALMISIIGTIVGIYTGILAGVGHSLRKFIYYLGVFLFVFAFVLLMINVFISPEIFTAPYIFGMGTGCFISSLVFFLVFRYVKKNHKYKYQFRKNFGGRISTDKMFALFALFDLLLAGGDVTVSLLDIFNVKEPTDEFKIGEEVRSSLFAAAFAIFLACGGLILLDNPTKEGKADLALICCIISLAFGSLFFGLGIWRANS